LTEQNVSEEQIRQQLKDVAYRFADACVEKALLRLREHPERSPTPWNAFDRSFLRHRLIEEYREWANLPAFPSEPKQEQTELEDIGNFAAWLWYSLPDYYWSSKVNDIVIKEVPSPR